MIPEPVITDRVSRIVTYLVESADAELGRGSFSDEFYMDFDDIATASNPIAGTTLRGWDGGPFALIHRTGGQVLPGGMLESVDIQLDTYGMSGDEAYDVAMFVRKKLQVAPMELFGCVYATEIVGPMMLPDFEGSLDSFRYLLQWRLRFRL